MSVIAFSPLSGGGELLDRVQHKIATSIASVAALPIAQGLLSLPIRRVVGSGQIGGGDSVIVFAGPAAQTLTLPTAACRGTGEAAMVLVINGTGAALTIACSGTQTVAGAATAAIGANTVRLFVSDGERSWF